MTHHPRAARRAPIAVFALLGAAAIALGCGAARDTETPAMLPDVNVDRLDGGEALLSTALGEKPLLVWFWAPW